METVLLVPGAWCNRQEVQWVILKFWTQSCSVKLQTVTSQKALMRGHSHLRGARPSSTLAALHFQHPSIHLETPWLKRRKHVFSQWKCSHFAIAFCQCYRNIAEVLNKSVVKTQLMIHQSYLALSMNNFTAFCTIILSKNDFGLFSMLWIRHFFLKFVLREEDLLLDIRTKRYNNSPFVCNWLVSSAFTTW